MGKICIVCKV